MITGTIRNAVQLQALNTKWEQKKKTGNVLSKEERNERANWTQDQRMLNDFKEQLEKDKEAGRRNEIANKISSGQKLSPAEEQYLASYDPQGLADYRQTQADRKAYEEKLRHCKTKDEVQRLKTDTIGGELSSFKKVINDPYISISEKLKKAQQILGKTRNIQEAEEEFIATGQYDKLPTEAEQAVERAKERNLDTEAQENVIDENIIDENASEERITEEAVTQEVAVDETATSKVSNELDSIMDGLENVKNTSELVSKMEKVCNYLQSSQNPETAGNDDLDRTNKKHSEKKVNISV